MIRTSLLGARRTLGRRNSNLADYLIDTSGTFAQTEKGAREVHGLLLEDLDALPDLPKRRRQ